MGKLTNKTAIITGATGGAGKEICRLFAREGANVVICARNDAEGAALETELNTSGSNALYIKTDVTAENEVRHCVDKTLSQYGTIDILVNVACIMTLDTGYLHDASAESFDMDIAINLKSAFLMSKHVLPTMLKKQTGVIINFSSVSASRGSLGHAIYGAAKAGVEAMTRSIASQYGRQGIRANCIRPGIMQKKGRSDNPISKAYGDMMLSHMPATRIGTSADAAPLALFLACEDSFYVNGEVITLDGGLTCHEPQWKEDMMPEKINSLR